MSQRSGQKAFTDLLSLGRNLIGAIGDGETASNDAIEALRDVDRFIANALDEAGADEHVKEHLGNARRALDVARAHLGDAKKEP
jgi:hypothetical protein